MYLPTSLFIAYIVTLGTVHATELLRGTAGVERELVPVCTNTASGANTDSGCTDELPICASTTGMYNIGATAGAYCAKCVNNYATAVFTDMGCTADEPICVLDDGFTTPVTGKVGMRCIEVGEWNCLNDGPHGTPDLGCPPERPICVRADGKEPGGGAHGRQCARCLNAFQSANNAAGQSDYGCSAPNHYCTNDDLSFPPIGSMGTKCIPKCVTKVDESMTVEGDILGSVVYFNDGNALPAGTYTATYVTGCMQYADGRLPITWTVNEAEDVYRWRVVGDNSGVWLAKLPGVPVAWTTGQSYEACVAANSAPGVNTVTFTLVADGMVGVWLQDYPVSDNGSGVNAPTWTLRRIDCISG